MTDGDLPGVIRIGSVVATLSLRETLDRSSWAAIWSVSDTGGQAYELHLVVESDGSANDCASIFRTAAQSPAGPITRSLVSELWVARPAGDQWGIAQVQGTRLAAEPTGAVLQMILAAELKQSRE